MPATPWPIEIRLKLDDPKVRLKRIYKDPFQIKTICEEIGFFEIVVHLVQGVQARAQSDPASPAFGWNGCHIGDYRLVAVFAQYQNKFYNYLFVFEYEGSKDLDYFGDLACEYIFKLIEAVTGEHFLWRAYDTSNATEQELEEAAHTSDTSPLIRYLMDELRETPND